MKASAKDILIAKKRIELLQGEEIFLKVNEGRNRIIGYHGKIQDMYEGIFTVLNMDADKLVSYPYSDLITKNVKFLRSKTE